MTKNSEVCETVSAIFKGIEEVSDRMLLTPSGTLRKTGTVLDDAFDEVGRTLNRLDKLLIARNAVVGGETDLMEAAFVLGLTYAGNDDNTAKMTAQIIQPWREQGVSCGDHVVPSEEINEAVTHLRSLMKDVGDDTMRTYAWCVGADYAKYKLGASAISDESLATLLTEASKEQEKDPMSDIAKVIGDWRGISHATRSTDMILEMAFHRWESMLDHPELLAEHITIEGLPPIPYQAVLQKILLRVHAELHERFGACHPGDGRVDPMEADASVMDVGVQSLILMFLFGRAFEEWNVGSLAKNHDLMIRGVVGH